MLHEHIQIHAKIEVPMADKVTILLLSGNLTATANMEREQFATCNNMAKVQAVPLLIGWRELHE